MTNNNIKGIISKDSFYEKMNKQTEYYSIIEVLEEYIGVLLVNNIKTIKDIFLDNEIKEEYNKYIGIYFYISLNQDIDSLFIYQKFTDKLPVNACFLYCTPETTSEELITFLKRSLFCKNKILFCIINTELLSYFQSRLLINIIKKLTKYNTINSCLLIMLNDTNSDIYYSLIKNKTIHYFYFLNDEEKINTISATRVIVKT